jgi:DNA-binding transcriptional LysR family regulator
VFLSQLEGFVEVARLGNITRAAVALSVTQPALSARLKSLEAELGAELFTRTRRGVRLTAAGKTFLPRAERTLAELAHGTQELAELRTAGGDAIVIGATLGVSLTLLPIALRRFRDAHPQTQLTVRSTLAVQDLVDAVLRGEVVLAFMREFLHPDLECIPVYTEHFAVTVAAGHRFAALRGIRARELETEELVSYDGQAVERARVATTLRSLSVRPRLITSVDTVEGAKRLVEEGVGVALLPGTATLDEVRRGTLVRVPLTDAELPSLLLIAVRRSDAGPLPARLQELIATLQQLGRAAARTSRRSAKRR